MRKRVTAAQKHQLMTKLMGSVQGRQRIAASIQEPLRKLRDYVSIGRKAIFVDELPDGAIPVYDTDIDTPAYVVGEEGDNVLTVVRGERILIPTFELASNPTIPFSQVKERRFDIVRRVKTKAKDELFREEDRKIFTTIQVAAAANVVNAPINVTAALYDVEIFADAFANIERHNLRVDKIFMNPAEYKALRKAGRDYVDFETQRELLRTGFMGVLWGAQIFQTSEVPSGNIFVMTEPEFVGVMPVRIDLTVIPADEPSRRRFGWSIFENIGIGIHNSEFGLQQIVVS
jgi:hypothetical protein